MRTAIPMQATVRIPLTLEPQVQAMNTPVRDNQTHHSVENSLLLCKNFFKQIKDYNIPIPQLAEADIGVYSQ